VYKSFLNLIVAALGTWKAPESDPFPGKSLRKELVFPVDDYGIFGMCKTVKNNNLSFIEPYSQFNQCLFTKCVLVFQVRCCMQYSTASIMSGSDSCGELQQCSDMTFDNMDLEMPLNFEVLKGGGEPCLCYCQTQTLSILPLTVTLCLHWFCSCQNICLCHC